MYPEPDADDEMRERLHQVRHDVGTMGPYGAMAGICLGFSHARYRSPLWTFHDGIRMPEWRRCYSP